MLEKMKRILVIGPKRDFQNVVDALYSAGTIHLEDVSKKISSSEISLKRWEVETGPEISNLLVKVSGLLLTLPTTITLPDAWEEMYQDLFWKSHDEIIARTHEVLDEVETITRDDSAKKIDLEYSITALNRYEKTIQRIQPLEKQLPFIEGYEVTVLLIQKEFYDVLDLIRDELLKITNNKFELVTTEIDEETVATIAVFHRRYSEQVHSFIFSKNVNEVRLPEEYMGKPFDEVLKLIEIKRRMARDELATINEGLASLSEKWGLELSALKVVLEDKDKEIRAFSNFGHTNHTFMMSGWVPEIYIKQTKDLIRDRFGEKVVLAVLKISPEEYGEAPALYANPRIVKPFEFFNQLVSPPNYREVDPSPLIAFFFPFFFGLMVGDIGYGLIILGIALFGRFKFGDIDWIKSLSSVLIISAISTIFFGFLYGEFFGNFGEHMGWIEPVHFLGITWNRIEALLPMLILSIAVGVLHVFIGLGIGVFNAVVKKSRKHIAEKVGMLAAVTGLLLLVGVAAGMLPAAMLTPGIVVVIVALCLIVYGAGAIGPIEIMGTIGNILSYARLMAIGMASVILAMVANELGGAMGIALVGFIIAALLHALNIVLALFSPSIHSIRLHVVECYSKFYEGGGHIYLPFKKEQI
jgi:V/A-type H+-transporting ATPase subunit I